MSFVAILDEFARIEGALTIHDPTQMSVAMAYRTCPPGGGPLPDIPCFMNTVLDPRSDRDTAYSEDVTLRVQVQFFCTDADNDSGMDIALSFADAAMKAFDDERPNQARFGGTVSNVAAIYGQSPFIGTLEWGGMNYAGFTLFVDLEVINNQLVGAS